MLLIVGSFRRNFHFLFNECLGRQISLDNNILTTSDTFAFDNSVCEPNDDLQPRTKPSAPPIPPRVPRTYNGNKKSSSLS